VDSVYLVAAFTQLFPTICAHVYSWLDDPLHQALVALCTYLLSERNSYRDLTYFPGKLWANTLNACVKRRVNISVAMFEVGKT